jgi:hypothetical protein
MSHGSTEHHLEHAEHAHHAALDPFDRRVAMTMTIMAAVLAGVTVLSHRAHTDTLRLATEAGALHTQATDAWNFFQAKNIRSQEFQAFLMIEELLSKDGVRPDDTAKALRSYWAKKVDKYEGKGFWDDFLAATKTGKDVGEHKGELETLQEKARHLEDQAKALEHESHELHALAAWIDLGHLGLELGLVFCAVAVLTKRKPFWLTGIAFAGAGTVLAGYGGLAWRMLGSGHAGH